MTYLNHRKFVVFDLDGTLIDSNRDIMAALTHAMTTVGGLKREEIDQIKLAGLMGKGLEEVYAVFLPEHRYLYPAMVQAYREYYLQNLTTTTTIFPGMMTLLDELKKSGKVTAIATTKWQHTADTLADHFGLRCYIDFVQATEFDGFPLKPDPYILTLLMQKAGFEPQDTVMVGDTDNDILCAQRAGAASIGVAWGAWSIDMLASLGPDAIVENPAHLRNLLIPEA
jgi:phosphoglycolate phosphatase